MAIRRLYEPLCIAFGTTASSPTVPTYQLYDLPHKFTPRLYMESEDPNLVLREIGVWAGWEQAGAPFRAIAIGSCELQNYQKQNGHRRVASGKIAIDRPLQQRKTRNFRRVLCPGGGENREGIAPQARSSRDAVSGVGLLHENDGDLDAHGRSECAHVHQSWV